MTDATNDTAARAAPSADEFTRLRARLDALEERLGPGLDALAQAPAAIGTAIDIVDDVAARLGDVDARVTAALTLLERVTAPATLARVDAALDLAEQVPGVVSTFIDIADAGFDSARAAGVDVAQLVPAATTATLAAGRALTSPEALALLQSPAVARALAAGMRAAETAASTSTPTSAFGLARAVADPDVQRTLGFFLAFARAFGRALAPTSAPSPPRAFPASPSASSTSTPQL